MSLGKAVQDVLGEQLGVAGKQTSQAAVGAEPVADGTVARTPVLLTALDNDEFGYLSAPIEPRTIRRIALGGRGRTLNRNT